MEALSDDEILSTYAYTPIRMKTGMVRVSNVPSLPRTRQWRPNKSTRGFGKLSNTPVEVMHMILNHLDFKSLVHLTRTCRQAEQMVGSLPAYVDLLTHVPETLAALSKMQILHLHSAITLYDVLRSDTCECCGNFGAFLFLITCQRCCFQCLSWNTALRAISRNDAGKCFNLTSKELKALPSARAIPGSYFVATTISRSRPPRLVSARQAKELGLKIHGSEAALSQYLERARPTLKLQSYHKYAQLQKMQLHFSNHGPCIAPRPENSANGDYDGLASLRFPSLRTPTREVDPGFWCRGCKWFLHNEHDLPSDVVSRVVPGNLHPIMVCLNLALRERSRDGFLAHARSCYGLNDLSQRAQRGKSYDFNDYL